MVFNVKCTYHSARRTEEVGVRFTFTISDIQLPPCLEAAVILPYAVRKGQSAKVTEKRGEFLAKKDKRVIK